MFINCRHCNALVERSAARHTHLGEAISVNADQLVIDLPVASATGLNRLDQIKLIVQPVETNDIIGRVLRVRAHGEHLNQHRAICAAADTIRIVRPALVLILARRDRRAVISRRRHQRRLRRPAACTQRQERKT